MQFIRNVRDGGHYDIIVVGAGPGGVGAALSAARLGRKVLLIDHAGCVGGYWTSGLMGISLDMPGKGGIPLEILNALLSTRMAQWVDKSSYTYDIEAMKVLLERLLMEAGVDILLYTRVTDVKVQDKRIVAVLADGFGSEAYTADWFVDGTGHGTLSSLAGCSFEMGDSESGKCQPASLECLVVGVPPTLWQSKVHSREKKALLREMLHGVGVDCSYQNPLLFELAPESLIHKFAINHQYNVSIQDPQTITNATLEARKEINRCVEAMRSIPGWEGFSLVTTAEQIGLRDSRRVKGLSRVTIADALEGHHGSDGIAPVHFCIDVHQLGPNESNQYHKCRIKPFEIPMGSLIAEDLDNLMLVGRCISGDFLTHSAYRTVSTACATGEAAGVALASLSSCSSTHSIDGGAVHEELCHRGYVF